MLPSHYSCVTLFLRVLVANILLAQSHMNKSKHLFWYRQALASLIIGCLQVSCYVLNATAFDGPPSSPYAWYQDEGIRFDGATITAWENSGADGNKRSLTRVVGQPAAVRVQSATGIRTIARLHKSASIWQTVQSWGTLSQERTIILFAHVPSNNQGTLFDGSTRSGSTPVRWDQGNWQTSAKASTADPNSVWQVHQFEFDSSSKPTGGLIVGANVSTGDTLSCDIAEILIYPRLLSQAEQAQAHSYLIKKWGNPQVLPPAQQPQPHVHYEDPRIRRTVVRKSGDDGVHTYRIPGLATTTQGTLIAVFDARNKNGADLPGDIDVAMMRSTDNGESWSPMQRIIDFDSAVPGSRGNGVGDPAILVDRKNGTIFVAALWSKGARAWNESGPGLSPEETGQLVLVKSTDDGRTWSKPISITSQVKNPDWLLCFNGPGNGIQLRNGTLAFPAQFKIRTENQTKDAPQVSSHSCFIASTDGGITWHISPAAIPRGVPTSESSIVELEDGSLLLSMRNESRAGIRAWSRWTWEGDLRKGKWSEPWFAVTDPTCMASLISHPHGELIFSNPNSPDRRVALTIRSSNDQGQTWSAGRLLEHGGAMYSSLTVLADGSIGILYESTDAAGLVFARFPLDWVLEGASLPTKAEGRLETTGKFGWWPSRHAEKIVETEKAEFEIAFLGDSITQGWENTGEEAWQKHFLPRKAANCGFGGDSTQHVLWRLQNGEICAASPKVVVLLIGTNNVRHGDFSPEQIAAGIQSIVDHLRTQSPNSQILLLGILPRGVDPTDPLRQKCEAVNQLLPRLADGSKVHFLNVNDRLLMPDGTLSKDIAPDSLHLSRKGYDILAESIMPTLERLSTSR